MSEISELLSIMRTLREPDTGCAWDRQQSYESLVPHTLEEAYEVAEVIENGLFEDLPNELGDLLFQVVFYCRIAEEEGRFSFTDVVQAICEKLRRRHPHVFESKQEGAEHPTWRQIKAQERQQKLGKVGQMHGVSLTLTALSRANKLQERAAEVGFDWDELDAVVATVNSELRELHEVIRGDRLPARLEEELGDLLFSCVNLARHLQVEPERALRSANRKFENRFMFMEAAAMESGRTLAELSPRELDSLWEAAKAALAVDNSHS